MEIEENISVYQLPKRLKGQYATQKFQNIQISTNFYHVRTKQIDQIHIFKIKFNPPIQLDDRATRQTILNQTSTEISKIIRDPIYSGFNIYSVYFPNKKQFSVKTQTHQVLVKEVKVLNVKEKPNIFVQFLNNGLRNLMQKLNYIEIGRSGKFFNTKKKQNIDNLVMYSGFQANFMTLESGIYLRVDTAKKIVRRETVLHYINDLYRSNSHLDRDQKRSLVKQQLINKIIMTNYGSPRYVKVLDIEFPDLNDILISGQNIPIIAYYMKKYNVRIENQKQPLLIIEEKRRKDQKIYMVPELCLMTGIPDDFDEFRRKKISQATIKSADQRKNDINLLMSEIKNTSEINSLKQIGIDINKQMETLNAKIIPAPKLRLGRDERVESGKESFFNLFSQPIYASKHNVKVGIIAFRSSSLSEIMDVFDNTSKRLDIDFKMVKISVGDYDPRRAIKQIQSAVYKAAEKEQCNICLVVIPNQMKSQYKKVKQICLLQNRIASQIVTEGTLKKNGFKSIATKILLQLIAKRGNTLWVAESAMKLQNVMLAAFDNAKFGSKNILGGVATINSTFSSVFSKSQEYNSTNEKFQATFSVLIRLIDAYIHRNKIPPKEVIIFSNSCSNDQVRLYYDLVIQPALQKLEQIYNTNKPYITFVMVNTKTSQRFFQSQNGTVKNIPAGTIISSNVVSNNYDFFMVSQFANRGCTVPNHYKVIYTDSKMEEGVLQELIYSQCFNYVNWTGSIKVPGILQYAKKCVHFSSQVLENKKICEELQNKLYFI